jgi:WD40 repeat protein
MTLLSRQRKRFTCGWATDSNQRTKFMKKARLLIICSLALISVSLLSGCQPKATQGLLLSKDPIYSAALSPSGKMAVISTANNGVQLWDLHENRLKIQWLPGQDANEIIDVALSPNGQYCASLSQDSVSLWRTDDGGAIGWWSVSSRAQSVAVADNGAWLVGLSNGAVLFLDPKRQGLIQFSAHSEKVNSVALSADGKLALSGGNDRQVMLWQTPTGKAIHSWELDSRVVKVALSESGNLSFASDSTDDARIWDNLSGKQISKLDIHRRQVNFTTARFVERDTRLLTGTPAREIILWRNQDGKKIANWQAQLTKYAKIKGAVVYSVAYRAPDAIVSISSNGLVENWSMHHQR